jgi:hypothetical protein
MNIEHFKEKLEKDVSGKWFRADQLDVLARLIIEDSIQQLTNWKNEPFPFDEDTAVWILKKHFGIEE